MTLQSFLGGLIAFLCAVIAVGSDAQTEIRSRFGSRYGTFVLSTLPGFAFIAFWGAIDVALYVTFLFNHDWAKRAFNIEVDQNLISFGFIVGLSAVLLIRTNLATIGTVQVGGELAYTWSRALLIKSLNAKRTRQRRAFLTENRPICKNIAGYPLYFTSLESTLTQLANGSQQRSEIEAQLAKIREGNATPDTSATAREGITGLIYDYFGPGDFKSWATDSDFGNK